MSKGRRKKSLKEYEAEAGFEIWEISPQQFDSASHDDTLESVSYTHLTLPTTA